MNVTLSKTLDDDGNALTPSNLTITASGVTKFADKVGSTAALTSLTTDAPGSTQINGGVVTTTADQTYGDAVTLDVGTTLTANSGRAAQLVTFASTLTGGGNSLAVGTAVAGTVRTRSLTTRFRA